MRSFGIVSPQYWTGRTGRALAELGEKRGPAAQTLGCYLMTGPHSHMCGLYYLPLSYVLYDTGHSLKMVKASLDILRDERFAFYDEGTQHVWVKEMCHWQLGPLKMDGPKPDNRAKGVYRWYDDLPANPFLGLFFERYKTDLALPKKREWAPEPAPGSPFEGASKGALEPLSPSPSPSLSLVPVLDLKGGTGENKTRLGEFKHVLLSPDDIADLRTRLNGNFDTLLTELDLYGENHPRQFAQYTNHKAVLLTWYGRRQKEKANGRLSTKADRTAEAGRRLLSRLDSQNRRRDERGAIGGDTGDVLGTITPVERERDADGG